MHLDDRMISNRGRASLTSCDQTGETTEHTDDTETLGSNFRVVRDFRSSLLQFQRSIPGGCKRSGRGRATSRLEKMCRRGNPLS